MRHVIRIILALACVAVPAAGDVLYTHDGRALVGHLQRRGPAAWDVTAANGRTTFVPDADVASIELTRRPTTDPVACAWRLAALRTAVSTLDDPTSAAAHYRQFIAAGADVTSLAAARSELAVWQDRCDRHLERLGNQWVPAPTRDRAVADALAKVELARQQLKRGQPAQAEPLLLAALRTDPQSASAEYLLGLIQAGRGQPSAAGRAFAAADALVPNHAATLNNLAVALWQQRQFLPALARYEQAMAADPQDALVLDNVAAALAELPPALGSNPNVVSARDRFKALDKQRAAVMAARGMHRFGGGWLSDDQMVQVALLQQRDRRQLDALAVDFDHQQDLIRQTDLAIAEVEQHVHGRSGDVGPYLASYDGRIGRWQTSTGDDALSNDVDQLQRRRAGQVAQLDAIERQATAIRHRIAGQAEGPPAQRWVGPEGTPLRLSPSATKPAA